MVRLEQNEDQTWSKVQLSDEDTTPYYISSKYLVSSGTGELEHLEKTDYLSAGDEGVIRMTFINNSNERTIVDTWQPASPSQIPIGVEPDHRKQRYRILRCPEAGPDRRGYLPGDRTGGSSRRFHHHYGDQ